MNLDTPYMRPTSFVRPTLAALLLLGAALLFASGCNKKESETHSEPGTASAGQAPQSEQELSSILASIDGVDITVREFQDRINKQSPYVRARYTSTEQKKEFLDNLIRFEVLAREAKKQGFDKNPDVVRTMKQVMIQKLMTDRGKDGLRPEDVSDEEMQAYYTDNAAEFHKPEEVRVSAIILDSKQSAEALAPEALGEKGASNKGFRELVAKHSTDKETQTRGGDLRYFTATNKELSAAVIQAAFALKKTGDVAGPIDAGNNQYYIIKQTGHRKPIDKSFADVKRQIQNRLYRDKRTQAQQDFVNELKKQAAIEVFEPELLKVQIDPESTQGDGHGHGHAPSTPSPSSPESADHAPHAAPHTHKTPHAIKPEATP